MEKWLKATPPWDGRGEDEWGAEAARGDCRKGRPRIPGPSPTATRAPAGQVAPGLQRGADPAPSRKRLSASTRPGPLPRGLRVRQALVARAPGPGLTRARPAGAIVPREGPRRPGGSLVTELGPCLVTSVNNPVSDVLTLFPAKRRKVLKRRTLVCVCICCHGVQFNCTQM